MRNEYQQFGAFFSFARFYITHYAALSYILCALGGRANAALYLNHCRRIFFLAFESLCDTNEDFLTIIFYLIIHKLLYAAFHILINHFSALVSIFIKFFRFVSHIKIFGDHRQLKKKNGKKCDFCHQKLLTQVQVLDPEGLLSLKHGKSPSISISLFFGQLLNIKSFL